MVFILGAGFSKGYNSKKVPLDNEFLKIAKKYAILKPDDEHKDLIEFVYKYFGDYDKLSIEKLASFLTTDLIPDISQKYEYRDRLYKQMVDIITNVLDRSYDDPERPEIRDLYQKFAHILAKKNECIISFNYDLILDNLLRNTGKWSESRGYGFKMKGYDSLESFDQNPRSKTTYLKLHGSLNWGRNIIPDPYYGTKIVGNFNCTDCAQPSSVKPVLPFKIDGTVSYNGNIYEPFIVPQILSKDEFYKNNILQYLWYKAKDELIQSEKIYVIGYSFPVTDYLAEFLFRQSVASPHCNKNKKIIIVNKNVDENYEARVEQIFLNCTFEPPHQCGVVNFLRNYVDHFD